MRSVVRRTLEASEFKSWTRTPCSIQTIVLLNNAIQMQIDKLQKNVAVLI